MYTECPACGTLFGVGAADLRAARGKVRCGNCLAVFDGLDRLTEGPPPAPDPSHAGDPAPVGSAPPGPAPGESSRHVPVLGDDAGERAPDRPFPDEETEPVPEILREDVARIERAPREGRAHAARVASAAALFALLGVQVVWFNAGAAIENYPQSRAAVEWLCAKTACTLPVRRAPESVQMVSRDVRVHPDFEGALRLSATIVNNASFRQPYPRMQFTLFNVNGQTIASRVFSPREYLSADVAIAAEMRPRQPLQIALDLLAPEEVAVSFEFRFL